MYFQQHPRAPGQGVPAQLQWKNTVTLPRAQCQQLLGRQRAALVHDHTVCTRNADGKGACMGDSGGPLTQQDGTVVGVVSWGVPCARGLPDVYFKLWAAIAFIRQATQGQIPNLPGGGQFP